MATSKFKSKPKKGGVNHLKPAFKTTEIYGNILIELQLSQYQAFDDAINFFDPKNKSQQFMLLSGSAGTGKTYLAGKIAEYIKTAYFCNVLLCAPTNKAVKVLKNTLSLTTGIDFFTIHAALGLQEEIDHDGNIIFRNQKVQSVKISNYDYVLLDEASMVDDELFNILLNEIKDTYIKVLFIGDKFQIPPVNYAESAVFKDDVKLLHNIKESELKAIIRQHHGNPIISFANQIKESLTDPTIISKLIKKPEFQHTSQITIMQQEQEPLLDVIKKYFLTDDFELDADYCKVLAWTNERVNKFNALIRKMKYGANAPQLVIGEKIIFDSAWMNFKKIVYGTNEEVTVRSFEDSKVELFDRVFHYYDTELSKEGSNVIEKERIPILKREDYPIFEDAKKWLKTQALSYKRGSDESKGWWATYYRFIGKFAAIKYNYAITVHKAQGSTYTNTIVANYDINKNTSVVERNRIKYTAVTRPKENLYIIV